MKLKEQTINIFQCLFSSLENLKEGDHAHLECRVEPINDPNLKIEWFVNGIAIKTGHRFRTTHDFGYVALDILYTYADDSGTYMAKATNLLGEAVNTCQITVGGKTLSLACQIFIWYRIHLQSYLCF
jgi:Immunoglobulin I-set domain.